MNLKQRRKQVDSIWGEKEKLGFMQKFAKAVKFTDFSEIQVKTVLYDAIYAKPYGDTVVEFYFEQQHVIIAQKFTSFLKKVCPHLVVETDGAFKRPSLIDFVMNYVFSSLDTYPVTVECSLERKLTEDELAQVKQLVEEIKEDNLYYIFRQFDCETCREYHDDRPIHFEIDNHYKWSHIKKTREESGTPSEGCFWCKKNIATDFCEDCEEPYLFVV